MEEALVKCGRPCVGAADATQNSINGVVHHHCSPMQTVYPCLRVHTTRCREPIASLSNATYHQQNPNPILFIYRTRKSTLQKNNKTKSNQLIYIIIVPLETIKRIAIHKLTNFLFFKIKTSF